MAWRGDIFGGELHLTFLSNFLPTWLNSATGKEKEKHYLLRVFRGYRPKLANTGPARLSSSPVLSLNSRLIYNKVFRMVKRRLNHFSTYL